MRGEAQNKVFFCAKFPLLSEIQTLFHKLLLRQTSNHQHCDCHAQKLICRDFQVILSSSSWSKTTLCIFKEHIWLPNRKCYKKYEMLLTGSVIAHGVQIYKFEADWMSSFQDMTYYDSIIGIFLNFFLSMVKLLFEVNCFSDNQILIIILNFLLSKNHKE